MMRNFIKTIVSIFWQGWYYLDQAMEEVDGRD